VLDESSRESLAIEADVSLAGAAQRAPASAPKPDRFSTAPRIMKGGLEKLGEE
jgi:hypothetical protein